MTFKQKFNYYWDYSQILFFVFEVTNIECMWSVINNVESLYL